jgi:hypothetical protein
VTVTGCARLTYCAAHRQEAFTKALVTAREEGSDQLRVPPIGHFLISHGTPQAPAIGQPTARRPGHAMAA